MEVQLLVLLSLKQDLQDLLVILTFVWLELPLTKHLYGLLINFLHQAHLYIGAIFHNLGETQSILTSQL